MVLVTSAWVVLVYLNGSSGWNEAEAQAMTIRHHGRKGLFTMNYSQWSNSESTLLCWSSGTTGTRRLSHEAKETVHSRTRTQLTRVRFLKQIMTILWFNNYPTPTTWLPVISGCFPKFKMALEGLIFDNTDTIKENTKKHLSNIQEDSLKKNVSNDGRTDDMVHYVRRSLLWRELSVCICRQ